MSESLPSVQLVHGDCLEVMPTLPAQNVQMVFADLPYNATSCEWDKSVIDQKQWWQCIDRCLDTNASVLASANMRLATTLVFNSTLPFCYDLVYVKAQGMGHFSAKSRPLSVHENLLCFSRGKSTYNPQMTTFAVKRQATKLRANANAAVYGAKYIKTEWSDSGLRYPVTILCPAIPKSERGLHPTQKPVALLEWLIRTYTNEGDTVLDPVAGSMTTAIAALRTGRNAICIEKDAEYFRIGSERVAAEQARLRELASQRVIAGGAGGAGGLA